MSAPPTRDLGAEREIDLSRWRTAVIQWWWVPVAGLVVGAIIGAVYGVAGGSVYQASVLIAPAQPFGPNGNTVLNYVSTPRGIQQIVGQETTLKYAADHAGIPIGKLRNNVTVQTIPTGVSTSGAARGANLIKIVVQLHNPVAAAKAADAFGSFVIHNTVSKYVTLSITSYNTRIASFETQIKAGNARVAQYNKTLEDKAIDPIDRLGIINQQSNVEQLVAQFQDELATAEQQLALAQNIEIAQLVGSKTATAEKTSARSRRTSILFGALIGLILGLIAAIVVDSRASRARRA